MREVITFLRDLQRHNDRGWFNEHKERYLQAQARFDAFVNELIGELAAFDPSVASLTAGDCTYRIYRDTRFSSDKTPYKTHMGAFIAPGGKKSGFSGYYMQVSAGGREDFCGKQMLATGDYCFSPEVLRVLREDIVDGGGDFQRTLLQAPDFTLDRSDALKRNPKGFPADAPYGEYIRLKSYCLCREVDEAFLYADGLARRVAASFATTKPFLDYLNRAIDYCRP